MAKRTVDIPVDPTKDPTHVGRPNEVAGCPTGLTPIPEESVEHQEGHDPLVVEKLEGRQESGRDAEDDAEEDLPP